MVVHKKEKSANEPDYIVAAKLCEPDYEAEFKYLRAEMIAVDRKLAEDRSGLLHQVSLPKMGIFNEQDWRKYRLELKHYAKQLEDYAIDIMDGVLPVKFGVYNDASKADHGIKILVRVLHGRVDTHKKPPTRPLRPEDKFASNLKLSWPRKRNGFSRRKIRIENHEISAEFSTLRAGDGATLINQLIHVHCTPDTVVTYEIKSRNVRHETGDVEF